MTLFWIDNNIFYVATNTFKGFTMDVSWCMPRVIFVLFWRVSFKLVSQVFFHCYSCAPRFVLIISTTSWFIILLATELESPSRRSIVCYPLTNHHVFFRANFLYWVFPKTLKNEYRIYLKKQKKQDKGSYHLENSISLSNMLGKIYKIIISQQATKILEENDFFKGKTYMRITKNKNASQALSPLIEQMYEGVPNGKYSIAVVADLQGAFDAERCHII